MFLTVSETEISSYRHIQQVTYFDVSQTFLFLFCLHNNVLDDQQVIQIFSYHHILLSRPYHYDLTTKIFQETYQIFQTDLVYDYQERQIFENLLKLCIYLQIRTCFFLKCKKYKAENWSQTKHIISTYLSLPWSLSLDPLISRPGRYSPGLKGVNDLFLYPCSRSFECSLLL